MEARAWFPFVAILALAICLTDEGRAQLITIDFTEGLAPVDQQHSLTTQYDPTYGVTFLPADGNNWTLQGANLIWPYVDERGAYVSASQFLLSFSQPIAFISFDAWLQSAGISGQGGTVSITVSSLTAPSGSIIESTSFSISNTSGQVWTGGQYAEPATLLFSPAAAFNYVSISRPVKVGIDSMSFTPVPEPSTCALLFTAGAGALWWARRRR